MNFPLRLRNVAIRMGLVVFGISGSLILAEVVVRFWSNYSGQVGDERRLVTREEERAAQAVRHKPNAEFTWFGHAGLIKEFAVPCRWNSYGFNDREYIFENPLDHFRIVLLGDSFVEALEVPLEKSFHKMLEKKLNARGFRRKYEVIALGRSGNGPRRNYLWLQKLGMKYRPDLVIMEFLPTNDIVDDFNPLRLRRDRQIEKFREFSPLIDQPPIYVPDSQILKHSKLFPAIVQSFLNLKFRFFRSSLPDKEQIPLQYFVYAANYEPIWKQAWKMTLNHIKNTRDLSVSGQSDFLLVFFDERFKLSREGTQLLLKTYPAMAKFKWDFDHPSKVLTHFSQRNGIRFLSLEPLLQEEYQTNKIPLHYEYDGHWNEAGHKVAAGKIYDYLIRNELVSRN
ncbi:SGNH/GDSL hydrolase family protein [bacterium]|nr:SGNH/GDSL hydrolase family protein [bacterium]MCI0607050.1 SGNH/GDSL hydrolase family protein [bacterium]